MAWFDRLAAMTEGGMAQWNSYGPTAARRHGRPGREIRPSSLTVDFHSHVAVARAAEIVKGHLTAAMPMAAFASPETRALNQQQEEEVGRRASLERRLADLDAMGIDVQVVKPPPPQCYYSLPLDIAVAPRGGQGA
jgi:aminocarboxymuconate-semialdehyde decarboxylase